MEGTLPYFPGEEKEGTLNFAYREPVFSEERWRIEADLNKPDDPVDIPLSTGRLSALFLTIFSYETHLSALEAYAQAAVRFSRTHENQERTRHPLPPPSAWPQAPPAEGR